MIELGERVKHNYLMHKGKWVFKFICSGKYHKPQFFLTLPFEECPFWEGYGNEDNWLGLGVYEK